MGLKKTARAHMQTQMMSACVVSKCVCVAISNHNYANNTHRACAGGLSIIAMRGWLRITQKYWPSAT